MQWQQCLHVSPPHAHARTPGDTQREQESCCTVARHDTGTAHAAPMGAGTRPPLNTHTPQGNTHTNKNTHNSTARSENADCPPATNCTREEQHTTTHSPAPELHCCALKAAGARKPAAGCASWGAGHCTPASPDSACTPLHLLQLSQQGDIATPLAAHTEPGTTEALTLQPELPHQNFFLCKLAGRLPRHEIPASITLLTQATGPPLLTN